MNNKTAKDFIEKFNEIVCNDADTGVIVDNAILLFVVNSMYYSIEESKRIITSANVFINAVYKIINRKAKDDEPILLLIKSGKMFKEYAERTGMWTDKTQGGE